MGREPPFGSGSLHPADGSVDGSSTGPFLPMVNPTYCRFGTSSQTGCDYFANRYRVTIVLLWLGTMAHIPTLGGGLPQGFNSQFPRSPIDWISTSTTLIEQLANLNGYVINWNAISQEAMGQASREARSQDPTAQKLSRLIMLNTLTIDEAWR